MEEMNGNRRQEPAVLPTTSRGIDKDVKVMGRMMDRLAGMISDRLRTKKPVRNEREEYEALNRAIAAIRYHGATLAPHTSPTLALRELLDALDGSDPVKIEASKVHGRHILRTLS